MPEAAKIYPNVENMAEYALKNRSYIIPGI